jgi:predicted DNA-binding antitoxin AbrB/MazE fold protein
MVPHKGLLNIKQQNIAIMQKTIKAIYEKGVFKPLEKVDLREGEHIKIKVENTTAIVNSAFGLLKGKDTLKALEETENEWGIC